MRRHSCAIGLLAALFLLPESGRAADTPYAGTWKVIFAPGANEMTWFIIKVEDKDSGPKLELVATHTDYKEFKLQAEKSAGGVLRITADGPGGPYKCTFYPPKGDKEPQKLLGSVGFPGLRSFVRLERTEDKTIDSTQRFKSAPGEPELTKAAHLQDAKEKAAALKEVVEKHPGSPVAYAAAMELAYLKMTGATEGEVKESTEKAIGIAADYGPEMQADAVAKIVQMLLRSKKTPALAREASAKIRLTVKQTGDDLVISVAVSDLASPGADTKLRLTLIEEAVRFPGPNRQRIHHHIVRAMPGGALGFALKEATAKQEMKIDLAALRRSLADDPIDLKHLAVVAFIQNDKTREVLQATQADVHSEE